MFIYKFGFTKIATPGETQGPLHQKRNPPHFFPVHVLLILYIEFFAKIYNQNSFSDANVFRFDVSAIPFALNETKRIDILYWKK